MCTDCHIVKVSIQVPYLFAQNVKKYAWQNYSWKNYTTSTYIPLLGKGQPNEKFEKRAATVSLHATQISISLFNPQLIYYWWQWCTFGHVSHRGFSLRCLSMSRMWICLTLYQVAIKFCIFYHEPVWLHSSASFHHFLPS